MGYDRLPRRFHFPPEGRTVPSDRSLTPSPYIICGPDTTQAQTRTRALAHRPGRLPEQKRGGEKQSYSSLSLVPESQEVHDFFPLQEEGVRGREITNPALEDVLLGGNAKRQHGKETTVSLQHLLCARSYSR